MGKDNRRQRAAGRSGWRSEERFALGWRQPPSPHGFGAPRKTEVGGQKSEIRGQLTEGSEETLEVGGALRLRLEAAAFASWLGAPRKTEGRF